MPWPSVLCYLPLNMFSAAYPADIATYPADIATYPADTATCPGGSATRPAQCMGEYGLLRRCGFTTARYCAHDGGWQVLLFVLPTLRGRGDMLGTTGRRG